MTRTQVTVTEAQYQELLGGIDVAAAATQAGLTMAVQTLGAGHPDTLVLDRRLTALYALSAHIVLHSSATQVENRMTSVLDVMIRDHATATVAGERIARGRHRTINDAAMQRCKEIARARRERVAVRARAANGKEHWVWAYSDGKVSRMNETEIRVAERAIQSPIASGLSEPIPIARAAVRHPGDPDPGQEVLSQARTQPPLCRPRVADKLPKGGGLWQRPPWG